MDQLPALIQRLASPRPDEIRAARLALLSASPQVIQAIRDRSAPVSAASQQSLDELNRLLDLPVPLPVQVESGRLAEKIDK